MTPTAELKITSTLNYRYMHLLSSNGMCIILVLLLMNTIGRTLPALPDDESGLYTNEFAVKVKGGLEVAKELAATFGYEFIDKIGELEDYYLFRHSSVPSRSKRSADDNHIQTLREDNRVEWYQQQTSLLRIKREVSDGITFNDPLWRDQWYLRNTESRTLNVIPVWNRGITGRGVVVSILDDGIEYTHDDLKRNYDHSASHNYNDDRETDPLPRYDSTNFNSHGTRCAGAVAAEANNEKCGVGIAFNAKIGGVRMLDGVITDALEARSLGYRNDYVDIYSCSWGPTDDSKTVEGPNKLAFEALEYAVDKGRHGKGNIFVWAAGNGGYTNDNCNCDGYASSIFTIAISSIENDKVPDFDERCSSVMAATYSFSRHVNKRVVSTDLHNECTEGFCGTSASAPIAAGIIALALEVNPSLTWRDIQHIIVWTSKSGDLGGIKEWSENAAGLRFNSAVGFGLMDADAIVKMAAPETWQNVPEKNICVIGSKDLDLPKVAIRSDDTTTIYVPVDGCSGKSGQHVKYLEHVEIVLYVDYPYRGALNINLTSFSGTETTLLSSRALDRSAEGFYYWPFSSVHTWGELTAPEGKTAMWNITLWDSLSYRLITGHVWELFLILHGTPTLPAYREMLKPGKADKPKKKSTFPEDYGARYRKATSDMLNTNDPDVLKNREMSKNKWRLLHSLHRK